MQLTPILEGDLLDFPHGVRVIGHGCNTLNKMGKGLALKIAEKYPEALDADNTADAEGHNVLGHISVAEVFGKDWGLWIVNLYQQSQLYSLNLLALKKALEKTMEWIGALDVLYPQHAPFVLGLPYKIGCGLAKGNWTEVHLLISNIEEKYPGKIIIIKRPEDT